ncbi:MAG: acyl-CoA thioesterase [Bacteroidetes bacterium]|nr:acyl-CoA thioesterase [Bacteroidota bacterium]
MYSNEHQIRVRYGETDQMGYLHHGNYPLYYEVGRVECMRSLGFPYGELEISGVLMPVLSLDCKFIRPVLYDEHLTIKTTLLELPSSRMKFLYELFNEQGQKVNEGHTELCFVDAKTRRPMRCPADILEKTQPYFS